MMLIWQSKWKSIWQKNHFLFWLLVILAFSINHLTIKTILTQYQKYRDQIKPIERLMTKLKYDVKNKNQFYNLPFLIFIGWEDYLSNPPSRPNNSSYIAPKNIYFPI